METIMEQFAVYNLDEQTVFLGLILLATVLVVFTLSLLLVGPKSPLKLKLEQLRQSTRSDKLKKSRRLDHTLESLAPVMKPSNSKESESIRQKLMHAGYHDANALTVFYAFKGMTVAVGLGLAAGFYFLTPDMAMLNLVMVASVGGGLYVPNICLLYTSPSPRDDR